MGKKNRNRINQPKKKNNIPEEVLISEKEAHGKELSAHGRKR
ncbi:hypothetical protein OEV82_15095 [Caldibacillus thermolactis]|jgi:hypothetical protein|uniref:Uncharacterized protein n=1 Tax=Pallidibacillus thermolactis TaxID=251051 RepID=A0ABT2WJW2_9BACI|nr:hypothetical protein [Pallidibacillus thermolactis]MCU9595751.1 hypothetical protein [Pallidibacillus thermolactis]MCU9602011.1 hypothetical protein [Pallidibacillus thermolactis subsp. kokeshiiformis]MED1673604.1 hypothetical protein [Pallidibacillus thermolactis subsp. kokeshiiformis]